MRRSSSEEDGNGAYGPRQEVAADRLTRVTVPRSVSWRPPVVAAAAVTGLLAGIGLGILLADGRIWPLVAIPLLGFAIWGCVRIFVPHEDRATVGAVIALSFALHVAVAVILYTGSVALGRGGFITGDDGAYFNLASHFVQYLQGNAQPPWVPPSWGGEAYLFGTWVYLESAIFFITGPEVLVPILLNGAFAVVTTLLVVDLAQRLFDRRAAYVALVLVAFYPSLVLWSSLNLKDSLATLLVGLCLWALVRFERGPAWWPLALAFAVLIPMESLRRYLFVALTLLIPIAVAFTSWLDLRARVRWTAPAVVASATLLFATQAGVGLGPQLLSSFESSRQAMAVGARTGFVEAPPIVVREGDTFVVGATASPPAASAAIVHVAPNTRIVVVNAPSAAPATSVAVAGSAAASPEVVYVKPGDIVVVGAPQTTPAPPEQRRVIAASAPPVQLRSEPVNTDLALVRSVAYFPRGLTYALFAPFPWQIDRRADLVVVPEMLVWYVALAGAVAALWRRRKSWRRLFAVAAFAMGMLLLLALVEGNVGTLYRHRAMSVPWILLLSSPALAQLGSGVLDALVRRRGLPVARSMADAR